jgi:UTP--glucose-1-phosphate uridylyltransferase
LALPGRYVFDAEIFEDLRKTKPGRGGEIQLTDGMAALAKRKGMLATVIEAQRFDAGDKLGYVLANIEVALKHPEIGAALERHLRERFRE